MHKNSMFATICLCACLAFQVSAEWTLNEEKTVLSDGYWTLSVVADGTDLTITGLTAGSGDLDLTDVAEDTFGFKVTRIGPTAFNKKTGLTSICAPDVIVVEDGASNASSPFLSCTALTNAALPSATTIGNFAFRSCRALYDVSFESVTKIGNESFSDCGSLTNIEVSADITYIGSSAFARTSARQTCVVKSFKPTVLPKLEVIGEKAFWGPSGSTLEGDFYMPALTNLGTLSFYASGITSFRAPSLTYLTDNTFTGSPNITNVEVSADITYIGKEVFARTSSYQTCLLQTFTPTTLPKLEVIGYRAFFGSSGTNLEGEFYLPALTNLGYEAMKSPAITSFHAPLLTYIPDKAFNGSKTLTNVVVSADITYIGANAFSRTSTHEVLQLQSFKPTTLPKLEVIGAQAFFGNWDSSLVGDFYCPALTNLGAQAFNRARITSFYAPKLETLERLVFQNCPNISNIVVRGGSSIGEKFIYGLNIHSSIINVLGPAPISIGANAFAANNGYNYPQVRVARSKYLEDWKNLDGITFIPFETAKEDSTYKKYLGTTPEDRTVGLITGKGTFWLVDDDFYKGTILRVR